MCRKVPPHFLGYTITHNEFGDATENSYTV